MDIWKLLKPVRQQSIPDVEETTLANVCKKPKTDDVACSTIVATLSLEPEPDKLESGADTK